MPALAGIRRKRLRKFGHRIERGIGFRIGPALHNVMRTNYVLVDYENVQPTDLDRLQEESFRVRLFLGPQQTKVPVALARSLHALGERAEYVLVETAGPNALDLHLAFTIGQLAKEDPTAFFHIVSKDADFDPLIRHLRAKRILARRSNCIREIPLPLSGPSAELNPAEQLKAAVSHLSRRKGSMPSTEKTLRGTLDAHFRRTLSEEQLTQLLALLTRRGIVKWDGKKLTYSLPVEA